MDKDRSEGKGDRVTGSIEEGVEGYQKSTAGGRGHAGEDGGASCLVVSLADIYLYALPILAFQTKVTGCGGFIIKAAAAY
jgi:hypothetical protein